MSSQVQALWQGRAAEAATHAASCALDMRELEFANPCASYAQMEATGLDGVTLRARLIRPCGVGCHPVVLMFHDAMRGVRGWHHMTRFVALGYAVVALENRPGIEGVLVDEPLSVGDGLGVSVRVGHDEPIRTGRTIAEPAAQALTGSLCDALVLAHLVSRVEGLDAARIITWGEGLGGGIALAVAALIDASAVCALNPLPSALADASAELDVARIAQGLSCPVLMGSGLLDLQAPPEAQDVLAAGLAHVHRISYPRYAHERINAFEDEMVSFLVRLQGEWS